MHTIHTYRHIIHVYVRTIAIKMFVSSKLIPFLFVPLKIPLNNKKQTEKKHFKYVENFNY